MQASTLTASDSAVSRILLYLRAYSRGNRSASDYAGDEPPLRSELFSADQMEQHGKSLASSHTLTPRRAKNQLLTRLAENEHVLTGACHVLTAAVTANHRITPAGEWLLDNFDLDVRNRQGLPSASHG